MAGPDYDDITVRDFLEALASDQPTPGGGAAAALTAAAGAALIEMVCRFSQGREQYARWEAQIATTLTMAGRLRQELLATVAADTAAFAAVTDAYSLPRAGREARDLRRRVLGDALAAAAQPALQVASSAATLAELAPALIGRTNAQLVSDLGAAGALLEAGLRIATYNVEANTHALKGDPRGAALQRQLEATRARADRHLRELRERVEQALVGSNPS